MRNRDVKIDAEDVKCRDGATKCSHTGEAVGMEPIETNLLTVLRWVAEELLWLMKQKHAKSSLFLGFINLSFTFVLLSWCHASESMALLAYTYLSWFSLLSLLTSVICIWVEGHTATAKYLFGFTRCEALAVFTTVVLSLLGALFIIKESIERLLNPVEVHTGLLTLGGIVGLILHISMTLCTHNPPLAYVLQSSQSSPLQEHVADICQSICIHIPALRHLLLPRVNPMVLISIAGFLTTVIDHIIIQLYSYHGADTVAALIIAFLTITTMLPLGLCSANLLLQSTPSGVVAQLDKCLREALTLDGVLEFRHEHFWFLGGDYGSKRNSTIPLVGGGILAGSLHVRVRRDANEQVVLSHVRDRLLPIVPLLTIQVFKDDWTRSSTTLQLLNDSAQALKTSLSKSSNYVNISYPPPYTSYHIPSCPPSHPKVTKCASQEHVGGNEAPYSVMNAHSHLCEDENKGHSHQEASISQGFCTTVNGLYDIQKSNDNHIDYANNALSQAKSYYSPNCVNMDFTNSNRHTPASKNLLVKGTSTFDQDGITEFLPR
ncbi:zinc transporter 6-A-like [Oratosquilla oratoria]|uniref:zinc transporter 6-A-like n=1 Tax=Oratosquilla oratoria TaxID=337810 RepID=UPI003F769A01